MMGGGFALLAGLGFGVSVAHRGSPSNEPPSPDGGQGEGIGCRTFRAPSPTREAEMDRVQYELVVMALFLVCAAMHDGCRDGWLRWKSE